jgi:hypothetical protein
MKNKKVKVLMTVKAGKQTMDAGQPVQYKKSVVIFCQFIRKYINTCSRFFDQVIGNF